MKHFCLRLLLAALPCLAPSVSAHPGHAQSVVGPVGWHAVYHGMEWTLAAVPGLGMGMLVAGLLLVMAGLACRSAWRSRTRRFARYAGIALGGGGLWLLLG